MQRYILGRLLQGVLSLIVVSVIVFIMVRLTGDPAALLLPETATADEYARIRVELGLDEPLYVQYRVFVANVLRGDFGQSIRFNKPALNLVLERYPATLGLAGAAILVTLLVSLPIGVYSAARPGGVFDKWGKGLAALGQAVPSFWLGLMLILVFGVWLRIFPTGGRGGLPNLVLPAITLGWPVAAAIMRLTRSSMLDVLGSDYIMLARAKGLSEERVLWRHALKNAFLPVLTFSVVLFVLMLNGAVVVETVFAWPGVGRLVLESVRWRDFPVIQTAVLMLSTMFIVANLAVDVLYAYINPRIRFQR